MIPKKETPGPQEVYLLANHVEKIKNNQSFLGQKIRAWIQIEMKNKQGG